MLILLLLRIKPVNPVVIPVNDVTHYAWALILNLDVSQEDVFILFEGQIPHSSAVSDLMQSKTN